MFIVLLGLDHKENVSISGLNTMFQNRYIDFLKEITIVQNPFNHSQLTKQELLDDSKSLMKIAVETRVALSLMHPL